MSIVLASNEEHNGEGTEVSNSFVSVTTKGIANTSNLKDFEIRRVSDETGGGCFL